MTASPVRRGSKLAIPVRVIATLGVALLLVASPGAQQTTTALPSDPLFNNSSVLRLDLRLNSTDWEKLKQNFQENTYYPADLVFNGQTVRNVGIRSRGLGSRSNRKPGLRVDFDRYTTNQEFLGLKSLVLDNLTQDASGVRETLSMAMFAKLNIPAPREAHARLYINNTFAGVYGVVETIDKNFLARVFGSIGDDVQNDGYLYEFNYTDIWKFSYLGNNLEEYKLRFSIKTHENKSDAEKFGPLEELVRIANSLRPEELMSGLDDRLDLKKFVRFVAAQNFMGENDGFVGYAGLNNFYLYRLENSSQHVFIAWDNDNTFLSSDFSIRSRHDENVLMSKAMQVSELRAEYDSVLREAAQIADEITGGDRLGWFEYEARRQLGLIFNAMSEDTARPYSMGDHERESNHVIDFARTRAGNVRDQLR